MTEGRSQRDDQTLEIAHALVGLGGFHLTKWEVSSVSDVAWLSFCGQRVRLEGVFSRPLRQGRD
jgi:hypothetical protein